MLSIYMYLKTSDEGQRGAWMEKVSPSKPPSAPHLRETSNQNGHGNQGRPCNVVREECDARRTSGKRGERNQEQD